MQGNDLEIYVLTDSTCHLDEKGRRSRVGLFEALEIGCLATRRSA